jgi:hypothetical protein
MSHIADHFETGEPIENSRPDFYVINDMWKKGFMSEDDHDKCMRGSERPRVDGLMPLDWEPEEIKAKREAKAEKGNRIPVTLSREEKRAAATPKPRKSKPPVSIIK